ncbi:uncharacterized protein LOC143531495 [Bidens hawaiensis]|uniref:uncharacterized protein LOC143531495 n=1 Tax=Bidens hawaiensis TaxID=980011 RepID=UPI00404A5BCD
MYDSTNSARTLSNQIDSSNPLYHLGMILISKSFDGSGFAPWKRSMTIALSAKNKLSFVNGQSVRPGVESVNFDLWQRCNDMVLSWILNTLSREISESVLYTNTASQLWKELDDHYGQANGAKLYQLHKSLCASSQGNNGIATYFTKMKSIWDELNSLNLIPSCNCGFANLLAKREEDQRLIQFLMGLNSCYDSVRGNILMMQPMPSISQAYALLIQDENQREIHSPNQFLADSASMNVNVQSQISHQHKFENKKGVVCSHCKKPGHTPNKCYRIIGFPKDFKFTKPRKFAANVSMKEQEIFEDNVPKTANSNNCFSAEQYRELIQLLQNAHLGSTSSVEHPAFTTKSVNYANFAGTLACNAFKVQSSWILDTGANDHM